MKLTKQQAIEGHRKMWNWIADTIEKKKTVCCIPELKRDYCFENNLTLSCNCFCCEYNSHTQACKKCPLDWGKTRSCSTNEKSLYCRITYCELWKEQVDLARQIANLPEREDVE